MSDRQAERQFAWGMGGINPTRCFLFFSPASFLCPPLLFFFSWLCIPFYSSAALLIHPPPLFLSSSYQSEWNFLTRQNYPVTMETLAVRTWRPGIQFQHWIPSLLATPHPPPFSSFLCSIASNTPFPTHPSFTPASGLRQEARSSQLLHSGERCSEHHDQNAKSLENPTH